MWKSNKSPCLGILPTITRWKDIRTLGMSKHRHPYRNVKTYSLSKSIYLLSVTKSDRFIKLTTTHNRRHVFGQYRGSRTDCYITHIGTGTLLYSDPDPKQPILCFGSTKYVPMPGLFTSPIFQYPKTHFWMHLSYASLKGVVTVIMYLEKATEDCQGLLFTYQDGHRECLGQAVLALRKLL